MLFMNWKPELGDSWAQVAAGDPKVDANIDAEASYIKSHFASKFFLTIHHEPENEVNQTPGSGYTASNYAAMFRHVEDRLRADGVTNIVYVMDYMGYYKWGQQSWFDDLYPGAGYVDWIAWDPYTTAATDSDDFAQMMNAAHGSWPGFYNWATSFAPGKPLMLAEWGVRTRSDVSALRKPWFFLNIVTQIASYPDLKALVYFDSYISGVDSTIHTSPLAELAFALLAKQPIFDSPVPPQAS
jgi:beta-mannanase